MVGWGIPEKINQQAAQAMKQLLMFVRGVVLFFRLPTSPTVQEHTHRSRAMGAPARWAEVDFPTGKNLAHCSART